MADVTHTSVGYTGTVDQVAEAKRWASTTGVPFKAASAADWAVTAYSGANRTVQIAAGTGACCGVKDTTGAAATLAAAANTSGSTRTDVVVATFNWAAGTPTTSFAVITGTSAGIPTINTGGSVVAGQINRIPGVQYDAVLAVLPIPNNAGVLSSSNVLDRRLYGSDPLSVADTTNLSAVDVGAAGQVRSAASGVTWLNLSGTWTRLPSVDQTFASLAARDSFFSGVGGKVKGDRCVCSGPGSGPVAMIYDGTAWRFTASGIYVATTDANGFFSIPHGGGQAPYGWTITAGYQGTDTSNFGVKVLASTNAGDVTVLGARAILNGAYYTTGQSIGVTWSAQF